MENGWEAQGRGKAEGHRGETEGKGEGEEGRGRGGRGGTRGNRARGMVWEGVSGGDGGREGGRGGPQGRKERYGAKTQAANEAVRPGWMNGWWMKGQGKHTAGQTEGGDGEWVRGAGYGVAHEARVQ